MSGKIYKFFTSMKICIYCSHNWTNVATAAHYGFEFQMASILIRRSITCDDLTRQCCNEPLDAGMRDLNMKHTFWVVLFKRHLLAACDTITYRCGNTKYMSVSVRWKQIVLWPITLYQSMIINAKRKCIQKSGFVV